MSLNRRFGSELSTPRRPLLTDPKTEQSPPHWLMAPGNQWAPFASFAVKRFRFLFVVSTQIRFYPQAKQRRETEPQTEASEKRAALERFCSSGPNFGQCK